MRHTTLALGLAALIIGLLALGYDLYGPTYGTASCTIDSAGNQSCHTGSASLISVGLTETAAAFMTFVALLFASLAAGSILVFAGRRSAGITVLAVTLPLLAVATLLSGFSIGYSFLPSDLLGILALVFATRRQLPPRPLS